MAIHRTHQNLITSLNLCMDYALSTSSIATTDFFSTKLVKIYGLSSVLYYKVWHRCGELPIVVIMKCESNKVAHEHDDGIKHRFWLRYAFFIYKVHLQMILKGQQKSAKDNEKLVINIEKSSYD